MNKYFKAVFCVPLASIKYLMLKIMNGHYFQGSLPAITSPLTEITCERKSTLMVLKFVLEKAVHFLLAVTLE